jgi:tyrosyl-tRNA synthetase
MEEVRRLGQLQGKDINEAKTILAYEATKISHGQSEADNALEAANALFSGGEGKDTSIPSTTMAVKEISGGINILELLIRVGMAKSKGDGRRLISQGGIYLNDKRIEDIERMVDVEDIQDGIIALRKGKKSHHHVQVVD